MKLLTTSLATATLALAACGAEPQMDESEVDPTFEGTGDTSSAAGAGSMTGAMEEAQNAGDDDSENHMGGMMEADTMDGDMEPGYEMGTE